MACRYSDLLGLPKQGIHKLRIPYVDLAFYDVLATFLLAYAISKLTKKNYWEILVIVFLVSVVLHQLFCVSTTVNKYLESIF